MPSKELIAQAAKAMEERSKELIAQPWSRIYPQLAEAAAGAIRAALQEQFADVEKDPFIPQGAKNYIRKFLAASALGEQSE